MRWVSLSHVNQIVLFLSESLKHLSNSILLCCGCFMHAFCTLNHALTLISNCKRFVTAEILFRFFHVFECFTKFS